MQTRRSQRPGMQERRREGWRGAERGSAAAPPLAAVPASTRSRAGIDRLLAEPDRRAALRGPRVALPGSPRR
jgi:hypothetical protein